MPDRKSERRKRWFYVFLWTSLIYSTLYIVRPVCEFFKTHTPFDFLVNILAFIVLMMIIFEFLRRVSVRHETTYILLFFILTLYFIPIIWIKIPEEKIHFLQYGFLAFLVYRALVLDWEDRDAYILAFFVTSFIGWGDEGLQHLLPNRFYEIRDVLLNSYSGALGLLLTYTMRRERRTFF